MCSIGGGMSLITEPITKDILLQYMELKLEASDLKHRIKVLEEQINKVEEEGAVYDTVKGGEGGIRPYKIMGFPYPEYSRKKTLLYARQAKLQLLEDELLTLINQVDDFIGNVKDSRIRQILRYKCIDNLTWTQVASKFGRSCTADSVRMEYNRFFEKN